MVAHGTNPDLVDAATFREICVMISDGMIGNQKIITLLGYIAGYGLNKYVTEGHRITSFKEIIGSSYDYICPEDEKLQEAKNTEALMNFVYSYGSLM